MLELCGQKEAVGSVLKAVALIGHELCDTDRKLGAVLNSFGLSWQAVAANDDFPQAGHRYCVFTSGTALAAGLQTQENRTRTLLAGAQSVYVYGFDDTPACTGLLRLLTGDRQACVKALGRNRPVASVTAELPEMCGAMSGLRIPEVASEGGWAFSVGNGVVQDIISADERLIFGAAKWQGVPIYLNACGEIIDIHARSDERFDVKQQFFTSVPLTMYLKFAFREVLPARPEISACLVVDDPPLRPRYGFFEFRRALELMDRYNFTTTIAFIPWNWNRTNRQTVALFEQRPDRLSLAVHGCDHTGGEFASRSTALLNRKLHTATRRMAGLFRRTSLPHDRVMIFPQGRFSPEASRALKFNNFLAATNTEVTPSSDVNNPPEIADLWKIAIVKYGNFPLYTRREMTDGVENFAFDALLGKPCLVVAHHDAFRGTGLAEFVTKLNSLQWNLRWRSLGDAIRHSYMVERRDGMTVVRMFGESIVLENRSEEPAEALLTKDEDDQDSIQAVTVNDSAIAWSHEKGKLRAKITLPPSSTVDVHVTYIDNPGIGSEKESMMYRIKVLIRRRLSEFRDNYLSQNDFLHDRVRRMSRLFLERPAQSEK